MNAKDKHSYFSAGDIFKYLKGDLSAREMQAMEAAALEDPFLADALEGMGKGHSLRGENALQEDMAGLRDRLEARIARKDKLVVLPFYRSVWKVAAAILLLAGLGTLTYRALLRGPSSEPSLAKAENKTAPPSGNAMTPASPKEDQSAAGQTATDPAPTHQTAADRTVAGQPPADQAAGLQDFKKKQAVRISSSSHQKPINPQKETFSYSTSKHEASSQTARSLPAQVPISFPKSLADSGKAPFRGNRFEAVTVAPDAKTTMNTGIGASPDSVNKRSTMNKYLFAGKLIDNNNNRIPLLTISFQGHRKELRTDSSGMFRVHMLGSDSSKHITISSKGYTPVSLSIEDLSNDAMANTIRLQPEANGFSDAIGVGYSTAKRKFRRDADKDNAGQPEKETGNSSLQKAMVQQAVPVNGWTAFNSYLEKNKRITQADSTQKGLEAISFKVNKKGRLSSFKIERSLSPAHDSLLLRLIRQGPAWKPLNGKGSGATVILNY